MKRPVPYGAFHLVICLIGIPSAAALALFCAGRAVRREKVLHIAGLILLIAEIYKQLFLFFIVYNCRYELWYFPFQLCSVPMYISLFFPQCAGADHHGATGSSPVRSPGTGSPGITSSLAVFMADFSLLGGIMTLLWPDGIMYPYITLTMHGFIWHFMLIFLGIFCYASGLAPARVKDYLSAVVLFLFCVVIAFSINLLAGPEGNADMFYISPWHVSDQPVFHLVSTVLGIIPGIIIYITAMLAGGFAIHLAAGLILRRSNPDP